MTNAKENFKKDLIKLKTTYNMQTRECTNLKESVQLLQQKLRMIMDKFDKYEVYAPKHKIDY